MARLGRNRRPDSDPAVGSSVQVADALVTAPVTFAERVLIMLAGIRQPIVAILLLVSFFTVISGKPLDGLLLATVAAALARDTGMQSRRAPTQAATAGAAAQPTVWRPRLAPPRLRLVAIGSTAAVVYALTVGSFTRYSWPATAGVMGLGASVVVVGWGGPTRRRAIPARLPRAAVITWGSLLVAAGLWELTALLEQPNIETSSYAHPTISTLTDPLLSTAPGRSVALLGWIALGAYLVER